MTTQRQDADSICCYYFYPGGYVSKQDSESGEKTTRRPCIIVIFVQGMEKQSITQY